MDTKDIFHNMFDSNVHELMEPVRDALVESGSCAHEEIIGQLIMYLLDDGSESPEQVESMFKGKLTTAQKSRLVTIADHIGPDWAQAFYHAAVFITKVA